MDQPYLLPEGGTLRPRRGNWPQHTLDVGRLLRLALRSLTQQILNDEKALGITARASLYGAASKFRHWHFEFAFYIHKRLSPLCPSIAARNMATLLTADLHPIVVSEIWSESQISTSLSTRIPVQTDEDGCPLDTQQLPQPTHLLQKLVPLLENGFH